MPESSSGDGTVRELTVTSISESEPEEETVRAMSPLTTGFTPIICRPSVSCQPTTTRSSLTGRTAVESTYRVLLMSFAHIICHIICSFLHFLISSFPHFPFLVLGQPHKNSTVAQPLVRRLRVHEIFLLVLSVFGIGLAQCGHTGYVNNTISCYLGQYFIPALHPGLNSALCLELFNLK